MKKRVRALLFLLLLLAFIPGVMAESLYFIVINYTVYEFGSKYEPWNSDLGMMVPHTVLTDTKNMLGLRSDWAVEESYFTLYSSSRQLTFAYKQGYAFSGNDRYKATCYRVTDEESGQTVFYVPVGLICDVFDEISWGLTEDTEWGNMVRIRNGNGAMSDERFVIHRASLIQAQYDAYLEKTAVAPPVPTASAPAASATPAVKEPVSVYLTFDGGVNGITAPLLDFLDENSLPALFFLPPETLDDDPAAVRRIAAQHHVGLFIEETDGEAQTDAARRGNEILREIAFVKTWLVRADKTDPSAYRSWDATVSFEQDDTADEIVKAVEPLLKKAANPATHVFSFPQSEAALEALKILIESFGENEVNLRRISPGELPPG